MPEKLFQTTVRFPEELLDLVDALADAAGLKRSAWVSMLVKDACAEAGEQLAAVIKKVQTEANRKVARLESLQRQLAKVPQP